MLKLTQLALALLLAGAAPAYAHSFTKGDIKIGHPWARSTPQGAIAGAGNAKITNSGKTVDRLTGGTFDGAAAIEIHEMTMDGSVMKMRKLKDGLEIAPGATVELKPGGNHLMITGLKKPVAVGPDIKGVRTFEKAGAVEVEFRIEDAGAMESADHKH